MSHFQNRTTDKALIYNNNNCIINFKNEVFSRYLFDMYCKSISERGFEVVSINLSGVSLLSEDNIQYVMRRLKKILSVKHIYLEDNSPHFRHAYASDITSLHYVFKENSVINGGSLYCKESAPNTDNIENVFVLERFGDCIAYVVLDDINAIHEDINKSISISNDFLNDTNFRYIKQCAVSLSLQSKGYGKLLYEELFKYLDCSFLSHVSVRNIPSLKLHYRAGFTKVGVYQSDDFYGSDGYVSDLVYRKRV